MRQRGTATSAIWNGTRRAWRTTFYLGNPGLGCLAYAAGLGGGG